MKKTLIVSLILIVAGMSSCTKEGPMGPRGYDGRDGADGATPLVYYFDMPLSSFMYESYNEAWNTYSYINGYTITVTDLVMVFVKLSSDGGGDNYWQALPFNEFLYNTDFYIQHSFGIMDIDDDTGNNNYLKGDIMFSLRASDGYAPYDNMNSDEAMLLYNVYILQGTEGKKAELPVGINPNNREEIEQYVLSLQN